jgi:hypothetical protein
MVLAVTHHNPVLNSQRPSMMLIAVDLPGFGATPALEGEGRIRRWPMR